MKELVERLVQGDKVACARLISIIEGGRDSQYELLKQIYHYGKGAYVVGITGPPGCRKVHADG